MKRTTDEILALKAAKGDRASFDLLVKRHLDSVYNFSMRFTRDQYDAEDVTQETFIKAWKNLKKFDSRGNFKTWLFAIAKNTALDLLKKNKTVSLNDFEDMIADDAPLPSAIAEKSGIADILDAARRKLSQSSRTVLELRYNQNLNFRMIGRILGESIHTVKSRHRRALFRLRELLGTE